MFLFLKKFPNVVRPRYWTVTHFTEKKILMNQTVTWNIHFNSFLLFILWNIQIQCILGQYAHIIFTLIYFHLLSYTMCTFICAAKQTAGGGNHGTIYFLCITDAKESERWARTAQNSGQESRRDRHCSLNVEPFYFK